MYELQVGALGRLFRGLYTFSRVYLLRGFQIQQTRLCSDPFMPPWV